MNNSNDDYAMLSIAGTLAFIASLVIYFTGDLPIISTTFIGFILFILVGAYILLLLLPTVIALLVLAIIKIVKGTFDESAIEKLNANKIYQSFIAVYSFVVLLGLTYCFVNYIGS